MGISESLKLCR